MKLQMEVLSANPVEEMTEQGDSAHGQKVSSGREEKGHCTNTGGLDGACLRPTEGYRKTS